MSIYKDVLQDNTANQSSDLRESALGNGIERVAAQIETAMIENGKRSFLFTSAVDQEGKTYLLRNTLKVLQKSDLSRKILCINANRNGSGLQEYFDKHSISASDVMSTSSQFKMQRISNQLDFYDWRGEPVLAGGFKLQEAKQIIGALNNQYDLILIDGASSASHHEMAMLSTIVDHVIFTVAMEGARREVVQHVISQMLTMGADILGIVFNKRKREIPEFLYRRL